MKDIEHAKIHQQNLHCNITLNKSEIECPHYQRALRHRHDYKDLKQKLATFKSDDPMDFLYISLLDRAHCVLKHAENYEDRFVDETKFMEDLKSDIDKVTEIKEAQQSDTNGAILIHSTGVYTHVL